MNVLRNEEIIVHSFVDWGGASLGIEWALGRAPDISINHDAEAIALRQANHRRSRHYCEDPWKVAPVERRRARRQKQPRDWPGSRAWSSRTS